MRLGTKDDVTGATVSGDRLIGEIAAKNAASIPFAIDHLGRIGPMARRFLFGEAPSLDYTFPATRPNAARMFTAAMEPPPAQLGWSSRRLAGGGQVRSAASRGTCTRPRRQGPTACSSWASPLRRRSRCTFATPSASSATGRTRSRTPTMTTTSQSP
ncbi:hypothetical protein ACHAWF_012528 [Thalassiosira exigua]